MTRMRALDASFIGCSDAVNITDRKVVYLAKIHLEFTDGAMFPERY